MIPENRVSAKRKSQAAMEFLLTYGWAILIVLVVISALVYYGVLDPTMLLPEKCILQLGPLACTDSKAFFFGSTNGQVHLEFTNVLDKTVKIESIKLTREGLGLSGLCERQVSVTVSPGSKACIPMYCSGIPKKWSKQGFEMEIKYSTGDLEKVLSGDLYVTLEDTPPYNVKGCPLPPGDGNGDGVVDENDAALMNSNILIGPPDSILDSSAYDFDNNGVITGSDVGVINSIIVKCRCCIREGQSDFVLEIARLVKEGDEDASAECRSKCLPAYGQEQQCLDLDDKDIDGENGFDPNDITILNDLIYNCRCCVRRNESGILEDIVKSYQQNRQTYIYTEQCRLQCDLPDPTTHICPERQQ